MHGEHGKLQLKKSCIIVSGVHTQAVLRMSSVPRSFTVGIQSHCWLHWDGHFVSFLRKLLQSTTTNQIPFTLVTAFEKNVGVKICLYIQLAGMGRWVEAGREELKRRRKYRMQSALALTFRTVVLQERIFKSHRLQPLQSASRGPESDSK